MPRSVSSATLFFCDEVSDDARWNHCNLHKFNRIDVSESTREIWAKSHRKLFSRITFRLITCKLFVEIWKTLNYAEIINNDQAISPSMVNVYFGFNANTALIPECILILYNNWDLYFRKCFSLSPEHSSRLQALVQHHRLHFSLMTFFFCTTPASKPFMSTLLSESFSLCMLLKVFFSSRF